MKNDSYNYNNKPCARCFTIVNRFDAERIMVNNKGNSSELFFHYDCYVKYEEGRALVSRKVTGIEVDPDGEYISLERTFGTSSTLKDDLLLAKLVVALKDRPLTDVLAILKKEKSK